MAALPFDTREGFIWMDGESMPWKQAKLHVLSHGLHYASSVFEGLRVYNGSVFKLREHSERLFFSARCLDFDIPCTIEELDRLQTDILKENGIEDGYIRPIAWRGSEMMAVSAQQTTIHLAIACWPWGNYFANKMQGIRLKTSKWRRPDPQTAPVHSKAAALYSICTLAKHQAEKDGFDDALMLDWRGLIAESTGANIFLVIDGTLHTPSPDCFLDGITKQTVTALAREQGIEVFERHIEPKELAKASEVFLTGTAAEITPVKEIDDQQFTPGEVTSQLIEAYDRLVKA